MKREKEREREREREDPPTPDVHALLRLMVLLVRERMRDDLLGLTVKTCCAKCCCEL